MLHESAERGIVDEWVVCLRSCREVQIADDNEPAGDSCLKLASAATVR